MRVRKRLYLLASYERELERRKNRSEKNKQIVLNSFISGARRRGWLRKWIWSRGRFGSTLDQFDFVDFNIASWACWLSQTSGDEIDVILVILMFNQLFLVFAPMVVKDVACKPGEIDMVAIPEVNASANPGSSRFPFMQQQKYQEGEWIEDFDQNYQDDE